ncbi:hypothetical protein DPMN_192950 [Dreissena polymorpha]|uniref:Uncharacterized protein n=1 Tax=Dreissena polymorpha TaxID=45954 RepID=A0A9D4BDH7_DREPO|nr:hypothetical protein DPMN_192950 [Dreissena polymorpha]
MTQRRFIDYNSKRLYGLQLIFSPGQVEHVADDSCALRVKKVIAHASPNPLVKHFNSAFIGCWTPDQTHGCRS